VIESLMSGLSVKEVENSIIMRTIYYSGVARRRPAAKGGCGNGWERREKPTLSTIVCRAESY